MSGEGEIKITGNTTGEASLRFAPNGDPSCSFTVAVTGRKKDKDSGQWVDKGSTFYRCSVWGAMAEHVAETLDRSGIRVFVAGRFEVREYTDKDGNPRTSNDLTVEECGPSLRWTSVKVPPKAERSQPSGSYGASQAQPATPAADPWATGADDSSVPF